MKPFERLSEYKTKFKIIFILSIIVGFLFGILKSIAFVASNRYFQLKMHYLILESASFIINKDLIIALAIGILIAVSLITIRIFLNITGLNKKTSEIIFCGILPSLLIFTAGGYWINKLYLPGFFELKSIVGNAIWALICVLLVWALGLLFLKISQIKPNFPPAIYSSIKSCSLLILILVILFNVANYYFFSSFKTDRPSLILISIDTLRADHLSCYSYHRNTTPNIDHFARDGVLFLNTIAQSPWTLPSHMSLFTGLYSSSHGVIESTNKLSDEHLTLAEILRNAGYETVAFTDGGYLSHQYGYQGFADFDDTGNRDSTTAVEDIYIKAVNWLRKRNSRPFFLFLHTYQVHCPYDPPPDYDIYSDKNYRGIVQVSENCANYYKNIKPKMSDEDYLYVIDKYDSEIYYTDHFMGKLFKELKDLGLYDKSIIVFTSDHGENFLDHPRYTIAHNELYDEIVKVPLIIKAPMFPKNQIIDAQVESIDIMPTVIELLGISISYKTDGESLMELVRDRSYDKNFAFSENLVKAYNYKMIRSDDWKLLLRSENELELFDLKSDPREQHNLYAEKAEITRSLFAELNVWIGTQNEKSNLLSTDKIQLDDELTEKLKALGYIN